MQKFSYATKKNVDQLIATAIGSTGKMRNAVQIAAVHILIHAAKHGENRRHAIKTKDEGEGEESHKNRQKENLRRAK